MSTIHLPRWLVFALITTAFWGLWGALIEIPEKAGFPATLGYIVWAFTMIPPAVMVLRSVHWKLEYDKLSVLQGCIIGFLGAGGQLVLFQALREGPAFIIFPVISLSPAVTIILSLLLLKEKTNLTGWIGISLALIAMPLLSYQPSDSAYVKGVVWFIEALIVFFAWGIQAFVIKLANHRMKAGSIFFYMALTALLLAPIALLFTDFNQPINWGFNGLGLAVLIHPLNSIGALCLVYAFRYGKAMIVSPMINALAPVITILLSLALYQVIPYIHAVLGMSMAITATFLMSLTEAQQES